MKRRALYRGAEKPLYAEKEDNTMHNTTTADLFAEREHLYKLATMMRHQLEYVPFSTIFEWQAQIQAIEDELEARGALTFEERYY